MKKIAANRNYKIATSWWGTPGETHAEGAEAALANALRSARLDADKRTVAQSILNDLLWKGFTLVTAAPAGPPKPHDHAPSTAYGEPK